MEESHQRRIERSYSNASKSIKTSHRSKVPLLFLSSPFLKVLTYPPLIEETFTWLRINGFQKYSFHFARYNIPFYALPFVNFFIIDEMGVTHDDQVWLLLSMTTQLIPILRSCIV